MPEPSSHPRRRLRTSAECHALMRDALRLDSSAWDEPLLPEESLLEWAVALDLARLTPEAIGEFLNNLFQIDIPESEWTRQLTPLHHKTVGEVCAFLAEHATVEIVEPVTVLGQACAKAGAFLTLKKELARQGWDVAALRPSAPLTAYMTPRPEAFWLALARLAPGQIPPLQVNHDPRYLTAARWFRLLVLILLFWFLLLLLGLAVALPWLVSLLLTGIALAVMLNLDYLHPPTYSLAGLHTFRDLATVMQPMPSHQVCRILTT